MVEKKPEGWETFGPEGPTAAGGRGPMCYVCSDLHGDYRRYQALLEKISLWAQDTLYVLGDVIDRGPDGVRILRDMMARPNVVPLLGNHELLAAVSLSWLLKEVTEERLNALGAEQLAAFQNWMGNGGEPTIRALRGLPREEGLEILEYMQDMALYARERVGGRSFVLVHAGLDKFCPSKPLEDYALEDFLFCRPDLERQYYKDRYLVYGHTPTRLLRQRMGEAPEDVILRRGTQIAIDCGCGHGGRLGCLCLNTLEEYYV